MKSYKISSFLLIGKERRLSNEHVLHSLFPNFLTYDKIQKKLWIWSTLANILKGYVFGQLVYQPK